MDLVLESKLLTARFKQRGAELCSIRSKLTGTEFIWQADPAHWAKHAPILFPIVGRLKDDTYTFNGKTFHLPQHGFAREMDFSVTAQSPENLWFELRASEDTIEKYPFDFLLAVRCKLLENRLSLSYEVQNPGNRDLLYSIGGHPAFNVPIRADENRSDYDILFEEEESAPIYKIENGLLTGETSRLLKNQRVLPISNNLFEHDALVFKNLQSKKISIAKKGKSPFLHIYFQCPFFGIWSKSALSPFICLEPWMGIADSRSHDLLLENKEGIRKLHPGNKEALEFTIEIAE